MGIGLAAVVSTLALAGELPAGGGDYHEVGFDVPAGVAEVRVSHSDLSGANTLDFGLWDPHGFRGWGGGLEEDAVVGAIAASRGYLPGPLPPGRWRVVIGRAHVPEPPARYAIEVVLRDAPTLTPRPRAPFDARALRRGERWYAGDFHVHSRESGDATATLDEIAELAWARGLDFVVVTDHNTVSHHGPMAAHRESRADVLLIRGAEITTYGGHGNAMGISRYVDHRVGWRGRSIAGVLADVADQGGLFMVNHPALGLARPCIGCAWRHADTPWQRVAALEIQNGPTPGPRARRITPAAIALWDELQDRGHRITALGGSDDHRAGVGLRADQSPIGSPTTLVRAEALSEAAILAGVRAGRAVVQLRGPESPRLELTARGDRDRGGIGDTVTGARVRVEARARGAAGLQLLVLRNGRPVAGTPVDADDFRTSFEFETSVRGDRYRAHLISGPHDVVIANHVYAVREPRAAVE